MLIQRSYVTLFYFAVDGVGQMWNRWDQDIQNNPPFLNFTTVVYAEILKRKKNQCHEKMHFCVKYRRDKKIVKINK